MNQPLSKCPTYISSAALWYLCVSIVLLVSWALPVTHYYVWVSLDEGVYRFLHGFFTQTEFSRQFWAVMNSRIVDNASHALFVLLLVRYVFAQGKPYMERSIQVVYLLIVVIGSVVLSKYLQHFIALKRESPSLILGHIHALEDALPGLENVKDSSHRSFPGDHAMTLILMTMLTAFFTRRWPYILGASIISIIALLPRLVSGAHWMTDIVMGSIPIASLAFFIWTFLYKYCNCRFSKKIL